MQHLKERFFDPQRVRERQVTIHQHFALFNTVPSIASRYYSLLLIQANAVTMDKVRSAEARRVVARNQQAKREALLKRLNL